MLNRQGRCTVGIYLLMFVAVFLGAVVQSTAGFAGAAVGVVLLSLAIPMPQATGLASIAASLTCVLMAAQYRKHIEARLVLPPLPVYLLCSTLALRIAVQVDVTGLKAAFGLFLVVLAVYSAFFMDRVKLRPSTATAVVCAALSGILSGLFGVGGPPMALYFLAVCGGDKERYIANTQLLLALNSLYANTVRIASGILTPALLPLLIPGVLGLAAGSAAGGYAFKRFNMQTVKKVVYVAMALSGLLTFATNV